MDLVEGGARQGLEPPKQTPPFVLSPAKGLHCPFAKFCKKQFFLDFLFAKFGKMQILIFLQKRALGYRARSGDLRIFYAVPLQSFALPTELNRDEVAKFPA